MDTITEIAPAFQQSVYGLLRICCKDKYVPENLSLLSTNEDDIYLISEFILQPIMACANVEDKPENKQIFIDSITYLYEYLAGEEKTYTVKTTENGIDIMVHPSQNDQYLLFHFMMHFADDDSGVYATYNKYE